MSERRFKELTPATMTPEQKKVADAIQSGPRGAGLRGPFNALLRSPEICATWCSGSAPMCAIQRDPGAAERDGDHHGRPEMDRAV